jgi:hypothetical protein
MAPPPGGDAPQPASPPQQEQPAKRKSKAKRIAVGSGMVVVAVAAVSVGAIWLADRPETAEPVGWELLPNLTAEPAVGATIRTDELFEYEFQSTIFEGFLDPDTGLAVGVNDPTQDSWWYPDYDQDYDLGLEMAQKYPEAAQNWIDCVDDCELPAEVDHAMTQSGQGFSDAFFGEEREPEPLFDGPLTALAAFDLNSGEVEWRVDPLAELGIDVKASWSCWAEVADGLAVVSLMQNDYWGDPALSAGFVLTVDRQGEMISKREVGPTAWLLGLHDGTVVLGGETEVAGYKATDLDNPVWQHDSSDQAQDLYSAASGAWWVSSADGYLDARTGANVGFGLDQARGGGDHIRYTLAQGATAVLLRHDDRQGTVMRIDAKTGEDSWDEPIKNVTWLDFAAVGGSYLALNVSDRMGSRGVMLDAESGRQLWSKRNEDIRLMSGERVVTTGASQGMTMRDLKAGDNLAYRRPQSGDQVIGFGSAVAYVAHDDGSISAVDLTSELEELWSLEGVLPDGGEAAAMTMYSIGSRLFAATTAEDPMADAWSSASWDGTIYDAETGGIVSRRETGSMMSSQALVELKG